MLKDTEPKIRSRKVPSGSKEVRTDITVTDFVLVKDRRLGDEG